MRPLLISLTAAALLAGPALAQDLYMDEYGVWRPLVPPPVDPPVYYEEGWREAPDPGVEIVRPGDPAARLRGLVPDYDDPAVREGWREGEGESGWRTGRIRRLDDLGLDLDSGVTYGTRESEGPAIRTAPDAPALQIDPSSRVDLSPEPAAGPPPAGPALAEGLARYAAGKRTALAETDPGRRLTAVRSANAYFVTLARGSASPEAIAAVDTLMGISPVTRDTTQLPGAGTELKTPDAEPTAAEREAAERIADYVDVVAEGDAPEAARSYLPQAAADLDATTMAGLDGFLGMGEGPVAATR